MNCIICLEKLETERLTPCCNKILFHEKCGQEWNETCFLNLRCPWCRNKSKYEQHYKNNYSNAIQRSFDMLKKAIHEIHYKQTTYNYYSALDELHHEDLHDADGYFYLYHFIDEEEERNYFDVVFKNKTVFHFWFKKGVSGTHCLSFSLDHYRFLLENPGFSSRYHNKACGIISEAYVD